MNSQTAPRNSRRRISGQPPVVAGMPMPPPSVQRPGVQPGMPSGQPFQTGQAVGKDSTGHLGRVAPGGVAAPSAAPSPRPVAAGQPVRPGVQPGAQPGQPVRPGGQPAVQPGARPAAAPGPHAPAGAPQPNRTKPRPPVAPTGKRPVGKGKVRQTAKQAHLRITKLDLLAVLKMSFLFAFSISLILFVGGFALWHLLLLSGAIDSAQNLINSVLGSPASGGAASLQLGQYLNSTRVVGFFAGIAVINVFILTLLGTVFGALYNLASTLFGGIEVTLEV